MPPLSQSRMSKAGEAIIKPTLETIASEVRDQIFSYLPQETLLCLVPVSSTVCEAATILLYRRPRFATTYRFAQFVALISHSERHADMVRGFKLADSRAGWREFKYKTISVYAGGPAPTKLHYPLEEAYHGTHPGCKFFPEKDAGGVPIGAIVHVLAVCKNIRSFALRFLVLAEDYLIKSSRFPPTAHSGMIFVWDVARSWTHRSTDIEPLPANSIIHQLMKLPQLEQVSIRDALWLTTTDVRYLLSRCTCLQRIDLRNSGGLVMTGTTRKSNESWAIQGTRQECATRLAAAIKNDF